MINDSEGDFRVEISCEIVKKYSIPTHDDIVGIKLNWSEWGFQLKYYQPSLSQNILLSNKETYKNASSWNKSIWKFTRKSLDFDTIKKDKIYRMIWRIMSKLTVKFITKIEQ